MIRHAHWSYTLHKQVIEGRVAGTEAPFALLQDTEPSTWFWSRYFEARKTKCNMTLTLLLSQKRDTVKKTMRIWHQGGVAEKYSKKKSYYLYSGDILYPLAYKNALWKRGLCYRHYAVQSTIISIWSVEQKMLSSKIVKHIGRTITFFFSVHLKVRYHRYPPKMHVETWTTPSLLRVVRSNV